MQTQNCPNSERLKITKRALLYSPRITWPYQHPRATEVAKVGRFSDPIAKAIGLRIRALREDRGESQDQVADSIGIERASLSNIERGRHHPALRTTITLAEYFNVPLELLVLGEFHSKEIGSFSGKVQILWEWLSEAQKHQFIVQMAAVVLENTTSRGELHASQSIADSAERPIEIDTDAQHRSH